MGQNQSLFSNGSEYLIGVLFGLGLMISGMTNPAKILAFLRSEERRVGKEC